MTGSTNAGGHGQIGLTGLNVAGETYSIAPNEKHQFWVSPPWMNRRLGMLAQQMAVPSCFDLCDTRLNNNLPNSI